MDGYVDALELTAIALGALLFISLCFIGLSRGLHWVGGLGKKGGVAQAKPEAPPLVKTPTGTPQAPPPGGDKYSE